ncbi:hypothetical protein [Galbitalea soli]|uniref:Uncharacterized protein n=1 Tax=Galbitalea soli TaxID=1268042 RepID=A0A7C9TPV5_9MICO|nr:hypothetical protein [Galbitalea soli]NEM90878.1 hypothetical protein [Galbitalea soli]NYJ31598.1 hypothetical protein [Galbitalea soli]
MFGANVAMPRPWLTALLGLVIGILTLGGGIFTLVEQAAPRPAFCFFGGAVALVLGIAARRRTARSSSGVRAFTLLPIAIGVAGVIVALALTVVIATTPTSALQGPVTQGQPVAPPVAQPAAPAAPSVATPLPRPPVSRMSMAQALGTLYTALTHLRRPGSLASPALAMDHYGRVFDPYSVAPNYVLAILPANTTLGYMVHVDRRNFELTLTDALDPRLVARIDTVTGVITFD